MHFDIVKQNSVCFWYAEARFVNRNSWKQKCDIIQSNLPDALTRIWLAMDEVHADLLQLIREDG